MSKRRKFSELDVLATLAWQGIEVPCFRCHEPLISRMLVRFDSTRVPVTPGLIVVFGGGLEREHIHELALGGKDEPENCRYSHKSCHAIATNGTKATSAGSSKHRIAKVKRLRGETKRGPKKKIRSRGFDRTFKRKMNGQIERRT